MTQWSPWGVVQHVTKIAPGIRRVSTASHGGIMLSAGKNALMPDYMRNENGAYEEDCECAKVEVFFEKEFREYVARTPWMIEKGLTPDKYMEDSYRTFKNWLPDEYEQFFKVKVTADESTVRAQQVFKIENKNNLVTVSAFGDWAEGVPEGFVCVIATLGGDRSLIRTPGERFFLVPSAEYKHPRGGGFVVDTAKYQEISRISGASKKKAA